MKLLTLIRHAKANPAEPGQPDFLRTLSDRGRRDAPKMGKHLKTHHQFSPDLLIASPAPRALATARCIAQEIGRQSPTLVQEERIYEAPVEDLLEVLQEVEDRVEHACLVGHNPGMERLTNWLAGKRVVEGFVTCGVAMLELNIDSWEILRGGCGTLRHYLQPRTLWNVHED